MISEWEQQLGSEEVGMPIQLRKGNSNWEVKGREGPGVETL